MNDHSENPRGAGRRGFGWACLMLGALVFIPMGIYGLSGETDRWRAAMSSETYLNGNPKEAIDSMREIVNRQPCDRQLQMVLARWLLENDQAAEAIQWVDAIPDNERDLQIGELKLDCLLANGQAKKALALFRKLHPASIVRSPNETISHLNRLAYLQALASSELAVALKNSSGVVAELSNGWQTAVKDDLGPDSQIAVASVLLYRGASGVNTSGHEITTREYRDEIMAILDPFIASLSDAAESSRAEFSENLIVKSLPGIGSGIQQMVGGLLGANPDVIESSLASMLTARALVLQDLGEMERSFADRRRIAELGHDAAEIASRWPNLANCVEHLSAMASFLDTRGCVLYKLRDPQSCLLAIGDLNSAVMAQESLCKAGPQIAALWNFGTGNFETADLREYNAEIDMQWNRTLAILLYHRSWIKNDLARFAADDVALQDILFKEAADDIRRIREMGFEPGAGLF